MLNVVSTPLQYLASFAIAAAAGALGTKMWQWHGNRMRQAGRHEAETSMKTEGK